MSTLTVSRIAVVHCVLLVVLLCLCRLTLAAETRVIIEGVTEEMRDNIRAFLSIGDEPCDAPDWRLRGRLENATQEIRRALQALGFYDPGVTQHFTPGADNGCWQARFSIEPGDPVVLRTLEIKLQGAAGEDAAFQKVVQKSGLEAGQPLRQDRYTALKRAIDTLAASRGYIEGRFTRHELRVDPAAGYADVYLDFDSGPRYRFGATRMQQDFIDQTLLVRFLAYREGEPYERQKLTDTARDLTGSGYFGQVLVQPQPEQAADGRIPVSVSLTPGKRHSYSASVGYATDTGPRLGLGYRNRRVNRSGHQYSNELSLSRVLSELTFDYSIPLEKPATDRLLFEAGYKFEDTASARSKTYAVAAKKPRLLGNDWLEEPSLVFGQEDFKVGGEHERSILLMPGISWTKTVADDRLYPRKGYRLNFATRGGLQQVFSDTSFLQLLGNAKGVLQLPRDWRVISRVNAGVSAMNAFDELPASVRFFAGGDNSVRGYGYKSLGPKEDGEVVGGRNLLVGSLELERRLTASWDLSAFVDSGNAFDRFHVDPKTGVGIGVRWRSPVGPVRLYLAHPLDKRGDLVRVHFIMGPEL
ncbi:MAG: autotransporter assembly complex family protein [Gammaproteobacteria bacterium]|jgi:translocation and assembly module TamA